MLSYKQFTYSVVALFLGAVISIATTIFVVDPFFHFHAPLKELSYTFNTERYMNDGITRHFAYDTIIVGTSMTQNFLASQADNLFGTQSIKLPHSGASYHEIHNTLERALSYNADILRIIRGLDLNALDQAKDTMKLSSYPEYLYDNNIWNDVNYLFNKDVLVRGLGQILAQTLSKKDNMSFDEYSATRYSANYGLEYALASYTRPSLDASSPDVLSEADRQTAHDNIMENIVNLAIQHPDVDFYYFYTPYSILYYDELKQTNQLEREMELIEYATSLLVQQENIKLFSFIELYDVVSNLDNYKDAGHYSGEINDLMMEYMVENKYLLTKDNYQEHMDELRDFYLNYPYDNIFK